MSNDHTVHCLVRCQSFLPCTVQVSLNVDTHFLIQRIYQVDPGKDNKPDWSWTLVPSLHVRYKHATKCSADPSIYDSTPLRRSAALLQSGTSNEVTMLRSFCIFNQSISSLINATDSVRKNNHSGHQLENILQIYRTKKGIGIILITHYSCTPKSFQSLIPQI